MKEQIGLKEAISIGIEGMVGGGIFAVLGLAVSFAKGGTPVAFLFAGIIAPYSPHLNIIEWLWKEMKQGWLRLSDYQSADDLFYAVNRTCSAIGKSLFINFSKCSF